MKELLIIKSVSFQQLDMNITEINKEFTDYKISILTHEHGVQLAKKYKEIENIYTYPYKEAFKFANKVDELKEKEFAAVIVPVTNITGLGFYNVLFYSLSIKTKKRFVCNVISEIREITNLGILLIGFRNGVYSLIAFLLTTFFSLLISIFLYVKLKLLENK